MKIKIRFSGRGGQGIKFVGSLVAKAAMKSDYYCTLSVDYTPSVRGGPIFSDVVISTEPIAYIYCENDADIFIALDEKNFGRAAECVGDNTICLIDSDTVTHPENYITSGSLYRIPFCRVADENNLPRLANIVALGFLSKFFEEATQNGQLSLHIPEEHIFQVIDEMAPQFREPNMKAFRIGQNLYLERFTHQIMA